MHLKAMKTKSASKINQYYILKFYDQESLKIKQKKLKKLLKRKF